MFDASDLEINPELIDPPNNETKFDEFCCELVKVIWKDPTASLVGVSGQKQDGVDISARYEMKGGCWGVQSKKRSRVAGGKLTKGDIEAEIKKAYNFKPSLAHYEIFTTMRRDVSLQEFVRIKTEENLEKGLFTINIKFWEDIVNDLINNRDLLYRYYPHYKKPTESIEKEVDPIKLMLDKNIDEKSEIRNQINNYGTGVININVTNVTDKTTGNNAVLNTQIDAIRDLLDSGNVISALEKAEELRRKDWSSYEDLIKFRLTTNIAVAKSVTGKEAEASDLFIEALSYNPNDEKALCNAAIGYLLKEDKTEANKIIDRVLILNPKSERAYSIMVNASDNDKSVDDIIKSIPEEELNKSSICHSIGLLFRSRGDYKTSIEWFERAVEFDTDEKGTDYQTSLAETILQTVVEDQAFVYGGQTPEKINEQLIRVEKLFKDAWDKISDKEIRKYKSSWLLNRGLSNMLLENLEMAERNMDDALEIDPSNPLIIKQKSMLLFQKGEKNKAIELIKSIDGYDYKPEIAIPFISILKEIESYDEALELAKSFIEKNDDDNYITDANNIIVSLLISLNKINEARSYAKELIKDNPHNISYYMACANVEISNNDRDLANKYLNQAKEKITEKTEDKNLIKLGNMFYSLEEFNHASEIFESVADKNVDSEMTRKLLNSYYRLGKGQEALEITKSIKSNNPKTERYITEMQSSIFIEINDLKNAKETCREYILRYKEDLEMKVRYETILLKNGTKGDLEELDDFLKSEINTESLSINSWIQLTNLYEIRDFSKKALENSYELRRKFFNVPEAHVQYIGLFFRTEKANQELFDINVVANNVSVLIGEPGLPGGSQYILDDRKDTDLNKNEIGKEHALYKILINKKINDEVEISSSGPSVIKKTIKEIKSKYIHALHDSMNNFNSRFPLSKDLWEFNIRTGDKENVSEDLKPIFDQVTQRIDYIKQVEGFYKEGKLTIGAFAGLIGRDIVTVWGGLVSGVGIRSSGGTFDEIKNSIPYLNKINPRPQLIIDPISVITLHNIDMADKITDFFGKLGVAHSTVELFREMIIEKKGIGSDGYMTIGKEEDVFVRQEISSEKIKENIIYLQKIVDWIEANCEVIPCTPALNADREKKELDKKMLGTESYETILISSLEDKILYSDDERLRSLSNLSYKTKGVWTQLLLMEMLDKNFITKKEYAKSVLKLINLNYFHTFINKDVIFEACIQSNWEIKHPLLGVMSKLREGVSNVASSVQVSSEFLNMIWNEEDDIDEEKKKIVTQELLKTITDNRSIAEVIYLLKVSLDKIFIKQPLNKEKIFSQIRDIGGKDGFLL